MIRCSTKLISTLLELFARSTSLLVLFNTLSVLVLKLTEMVTCQQENMISKTQIWIHSWFTIIRVPLNIMARTIPTMTIKIRKMCLLKRERALILLLLNSGNLKNLILSELIVITMLTSTNLKNGLKLKYKRKALSNLTKIRLLKDSVLMNSMTNSKSNIN